MEGKSYFAARSPGSRLSCCQLGKERSRATTDLPPGPNNTVARHMKTQCLLRRKNQYHTTAWMDARTIKLDAGLVVHRAHPLNAETSVPALMGGVVMPNGRFYIRNHFQIPNLNAAHYRRPLSACGGWFGTAQAQSQPSGSDADAVADFFRDTRMRR